MEKGDNYIFDSNSEEHIEIQKLIYKIKDDPDIFGLIRFGSSVKTENFRDIDLAIISKKNISTEKQYNYRVFLPEKYDVHFFHNLPVYIRAEILKTGIFEYIDNYDKLFDICVESIKEYSLFEPHFKLYLELN